MQRFAAWLTTPTPWRGAALGYMIALLSINRLPNVEGSFVNTAVHSIPGGDKTGHVVGYGLGALLMAGPARWGRSLWGAFAVIVGVSLAGAADEMTQPLWDRECDQWDWIADVAGAVLGWAAGVVGARVWAGRAGANTHTESPRHLFINR